MNMIPKLASDGTNFLHWKKKLDFMLLDKDVAYVLTDPKSNKEWDHADVTCCDIILSSINENLALMFQDKPTAKSLMEALMVHFKPTFSRRVALYRKYYNSRMGVGCPIGRHIAQMGAMAAELEAMGIELSETLKVMVLVESLPKSWKDAVLSDGWLTRMDSEEGPSMKVVLERLRSIGDTRALRNNEMEIRSMLIVSLVIGIISQVLSML